MWSYIAFYYLKISVWTWRQKIYNAHSTRGLSRACVCVCVGGGVIEWVEGVFWSKTDLILLLNSALTTILFCETKLLKPISISYDTYLWQFLVCLDFDVHSPEVEAGASVSSQPSPYPHSQAALFARMVAVLLHNKEYKQYSSFPFWVGKKYLFGTVSIRTVISLITGLS